MSILHDKGSLRLLGLLRALALLARGSGAGPIPPAARGGVPRQDPGVGRQPLRQRLTLTS